MNRLSYPGSDLDLYVEHNFALAIAKWLRSIGYEFTPRPAQDPNISLAMNEVDVEGFHPDDSIHHSMSESLSYFGRGVACVFNFHKGVPDRKIQLITCYHSPLEVILNFHSSESKITLSSLFDGLIEADCCFIIIIDT